MQALVDWLRGPEGADLGFAKWLSVSCALVLIKTIVNLYDLISQPVFYFKHKVYEKQQQYEQTTRSKQIDPSDPCSPWRQVELGARQAELEAHIDSFSSYDQMMRASFAKHAARPCYAFRQVLNEKWVKKADSDKLLRQVKLSEYKWVSFYQFEQQIEAARRAFLVLAGVRARDKVMLYADTRAEWQIASQALLRLGAVVVTMYSTLGVDGIVHSVNETSVSLVVTQRDKVSKLLRLKPRLGLLKKIVYFDQLQVPSEQQAGAKTTITTQTAPAKASPKTAIKSCNNKSASSSSSSSSSGTSCNEDGGDHLINHHHADLEQDEDDPNCKTHFEHDSVECLNFNYLLQQGSQQADTTLVDSAELAKLEQACQRELEKRTKDTIAVIMYTSGSTGVPKGVLISHGNVMATLKSFSHVTKAFVYNIEENVCTAYLPLAHIFEFSIQSMNLLHGVSYGFATPHTLTDKSPGLQPGEKGDLTLLQPTVMIIVPLILDRIVQGIKQALKAQSYFKEQLVTYLINYKSYWQKKHYKTPIVDKIVCKKIAAALGGKAKYVICGSAPLAGETQTFVRAALDLKLPQGFGTTETCAATACQLFDDQSTGNVGLPVAGALIKLEPWLEGNYRPTDKPNPRGEIVVGGDMIAQGYYNLKEQTKEAFYEDLQGIKWYRTGDIGEFLPNGNLKIIDRKKDLVKLQNGEYISLGKVESTLKSNQFTDNFCVYANSRHNYVVALGPANEQAIRNLAQQLLDDEQRKSPSAMKRNEESRGPLMADREREDLLEELRDVLGSYESDKLNNNDRDQQAYERKMSSLSTNSTSGNQQQQLNERLNRLCQNKLIQNYVLVQIRNLARERNLMSLEVPKRVLLLAEEWTEDKNLVTAAMKIRRNYIYKRYERELEAAYAATSGKAAK